MRDNHYLELLARQYPTADSASVEIINLEAISCLPKGTEYFLSDIHGEADAFEYLIGTASGVIREKIEMLFKNSLPEPERVELSLLIFRPKEIFLEKCNLSNFEDWCRVTIYRLVQVCKIATSKYTRSKVRKKMPDIFAYILDELLHSDTENNKEDYYSSIINSIVDIESSEKFIISICSLIKQCAIDRLHIVGDIFDRGPHADKVMEHIMSFKDVDIEWGNHDIHWMGAAKGSYICVASVLRLAISYNNFDLLEYSYGINLRPLSTFALEVYKDDPCTIFMPHNYDVNLYDPVDINLAAKMHKAIAIIQFKLEGSLILKHPEYGMEDRALLSFINFEKQTININGHDYALSDGLFPTVNKDNPFLLTEEESDLIKMLAFSFINSSALQKHINFIHTYGSVYKIVNGNLLYHGCVPTDKNGDFEKINIDGKLLSGREYLDAVDKKIRKAFYSEEGSLEHEDALDYFWYLFSGPKSPLFGKSKLTTFERYFVGDKTAWTEDYDPYYYHVEKREYAEKILKEFNLDINSSHIINGHVPVRHNKGESPIKGTGILFVIDGGLSKAYHGKTGIGGYTLISNSNCMILAEHRPFEEVVKSGFRIFPKRRIVDQFKRRVTVSDTDIGKELKMRIEDLKELVSAYSDGRLREYTK